MDGYCNKEFARTEAGQGNGLKLFPAAKAVGISYARLPGPALFRLKLLIYIGVKHLARLVLLFLQAIPKQCRL